MKITKKYLKENPDHVFVFGDNLDREGLGGAAILRNEQNTYGFITKRHPNNQDESFYRPENYQDMFHLEMEKLGARIKANPHKTYLISKLGAGLANKYKIWEKIIKPGLKLLEKKCPNVEFLF